MKRSFTALFVILAAFTGCLAEPKAEPRVPDAPGPVVPEHEPTAVFHGDVSFTQAERDCLVASALQWQVQTQGLATAKFVWDYDPNNHISKAKHVLDDKVIRWQSSMTEVKDLDAHAGGTVLGYCSGDVHQDPYPPVQIVMITDRFRDAHMCRLVAIHELGHAWGMNHIDGQENIMYPSIVLSRKDCLTDADLEEFCAKNDCSGVTLKGC